MYFIVKNEGPGRNEDSRSNQELLADSIRGNFQGSQVDDNKKIQELITDLNFVSFFGQLLLSHFFVYYHLNHF